MTDSSANLSTQPGWYPDPSGLGRQRYWDGTRWTDQLHDPVTGAYGALPGAALGAETPVYNALIWTIVLLPLVSLIVSSAMATNTFATRSTSGSPLVDPLFLVSQALGWGIYLTTVLFAFFDRRQLLADGFARPFHWAWAFLSGAVYVIGRSVIVRRRAGRGMAPFWVWLAVTLLIVGVSLAKVLAVLPSVMSNLRG
jgi:predicted Co/Zn/Cd cation transporter (cation efflux family)